MAGPRACKLPLAFILRPEREGGRGGEIDGKGHKEGETEREGEREREREREERKNARKTEIQKEGGRSEYINEGRQSHDE